MSLLQLIGFYNREKSVYCAVQAGYLKTLLFVFKC